MSFEFKKDMSCEALSYEFKKVMSVELFSSIQNVLRHRYANKTRAFKTDSNASGTFLHFPKLFMIQNS